MQEKRSNIGGVSRILYPGNARRRPFIFAIYPELSDNAGRCGRHLIPVRPCFGRGLPCSWTLVLARWALTPPFHPYPGDGAVYFLWHCPARGVLSTVSQISPGLPVLRSPDFPLSLQLRLSGRPRRYSTRIKPNPSQSEWQRADSLETVARNSGRTARTLQMPGFMEMRNSSQFGWTIDGNTSNFTRCDSQQNPNSP